MLRKPEADKKERELEAQAPPAATRKSYSYAMWQGSPAVEGPPIDTTRMRLQR